MRRITGILITVLLLANQSFGQSLLTEDIVLFADGMTDRWEVNTVDKVLFNMEETAEVFEGAHALSLEPQPVTYTFTIEHAVPAPINPAGYKALRFAFHPGTTEGSTNAFNVVLSPNFHYHPNVSPPSLNLFQIDLEEAELNVEDKEWQVVEVPLDLFKIAGHSQDEISLPPIEGFQFRGRMKGRFYLDDVRLISVGLEAPTEDEVLFGDHTNPNWEIKSTSNVGLDHESVGEVYDGTAALGLDGLKDSEFGGYRLAYLPIESINPIGYKALRFAFHPGTLTDAADKSFNIKVNPANRGAGPEGKAPIIELLQGDLEDIKLDLDDKRWQIVEIPLDLFKLTQPINEIRFSSDLKGQFYLDDIRLVSSISTPSNTAVLEQRTDTEPLDFNLHQNYPNPFNSGTVIRFDLPATSLVELSLYNLAGQKVTTLAQGMRPAGTYALHWDGNDNSGRNLASGLYLYRLQVGNQIFTRKLSLLR